MPNAFFAECPNERPSLHEGVESELISHTSWNQTVVYKCEDGFTLYPATYDKIHCAVDGEWKIETLGICLNDEKLKSLKTFKT